MEKKGLRLRNIAIVAILVVLIAAIPVWYVYFRQPSTKKELIVADWGGTYMESMHEIGRLFEAKTGIKVSVDPHTGAAAGYLAKLQGQFPNPETDIVVWGSSAGVQAFKLGMVIPLERVWFPAAAEVPEAMWYYYAGTTVVCAPYATGGDVWVYRTDYVTEDIYGWEQLIKPEYKGKIAIPSVPYGGGSVLLQLAKMRGGDEYNIDPGFEALKYLAEIGNVAYIYESEADALRLLSTGEAWICLTTNMNCVTLSKEGLQMANNVQAAKDANVSVTIIVYGGGGYGPSIVNGPQIEESKEFLNFFFEHLELRANYTGEWVTLPVKVDPITAHFRPSPEQMKQYAYSPDPIECMDKLEQWTARFEQEILPLIG